MRDWLLGEMLESGKLVTGDVKPLLGIQWKTLVGAAVAPSPEVTRGSLRQDLEN